MRCLWVLLALCLAGCSSTGGTTEARENGFPPSKELSREEVEKRYGAIVVDFSGAISIAHEIDILARASPVPVVVEAEVMFELVNAHVETTLPESTSMTLPEFLGMVDPDHRRGGIGSALFAAAKSECERRGADALLLVREQGSAGAEPFSRSVGGQYHFSEYCLQLDPALFSRTDTLPANTTIGAAGREDADALTAIRTAAFGGDAAHARSAIRTWLGAPKQRIFIARIRDEPIGMVRLQDLQDVAFINGLAVLPDRQGQGLGRALLQHAVATRLDEGETPIRLEVETENRGALALYLDCGFRETTTYHYDYCPVQRSMRWV